MEDETQNTITSVETALSVLEALDEMEPVGVTQLASELGIPTSTVFVHLNTLAAAGYVVKDGTTYRRSLQFLQIGGKVRQQQRIPSILQQKVEELAQHTGEIAGAATEEQGKRVILYRSAGQMAASDELPIGEHSYMHWTSLGKVLLAHLPEETTADIVDQHGLPAGTERTITSRDELQNELETIRAQQYAIDDEEHLQGIRGVAVPILDSNRHVIASIGVTGPRNRFTSPYIAELAETLQYVQNEIEVKYQHYR